MLIQKETFFVEDHALPYNDEWVRTSKGYMIFKTEILKRDGLNLDDIKLLFSEKKLAISNGSFWKIYTVVDDNGKVIY